MSDLKQVIVVRSDLVITRAKLASQVAHASVESVLMSDPQLVSIWKSEGMKKVILEVEDEEKLRELIQKGKTNGLVSVLIEDNGLTELKENTITCGAIGPDENRKIDKLTGGLKLLV